MLVALSTVAWAPVPTGFFLTPLLCWYFCLCLSATCLPFIFLILGLIVWLQLVWNLLCRLGGSQTYKRHIFLHLTSARIKDVCHHTWQSFSLKWLLFYFWLPPQLVPITVSHQSHLSELQSHSILMLASSYSISY